MALELKTSAATAQAHHTEGWRHFDLKKLMKPRVGLQDRMFFTEQLALLLETGTSLLDSLRALRQQSANPVMRDVIGEIIDDISMGRPFSQALGKQNEVFPETYVKLISASEAGGYVHKVLYQLQAMDEKRKELTSTLASALSYPAFLLVFSIAVVVFVLVAVFPKFGDLFVSIEDQLPATTRFLMTLSDMLLNNGVAIGLGFCLLLVTLGRWLATRTGKATIDRLMLTAPILRNIFGEFILIQFLRVMSLSLSSGVPMLDALAGARAVIQNSVFKRMIDEIQDSIQGGKGLASTLEDAAFVPALAKTMLKTAEDTGNFAPVASRVADYYEQELVRRLKTLSRMAEPVMLIVMGAVVGLLVSSLILPIFKLSRAVA